MVYFKWISSCLLTLLFCSFVSMQNQIKRVPIGTTHVKVDCYEPRKAQTDWRYTVDVYVITIDNGEDFFDEIKIARYSPSRNRTAIYNDSKYSVQFTSEGKLIITAEDNTFLSKVSRHIVRCGITSTIGNANMRTTIDVFDPDDPSANIFDNNEKYSFEISKSRIFKQETNFIPIVIIALLVSLLIIVAIVIYSYKKKWLTSEYTETEGDSYEYRYTSEKSN